jgi:hypothetical protein
MKTPKDERLVIDIPASLLRKQGENKQASQPVRGDYRAFARTGISIIEVPRNTEHGVTTIESLGFATEAARDAVLGLLRLPALYAQLPQIYEHLRQLGCEQAFEPRYYAAKAVSVLWRVLSFVELKENVVLPWAKSGNAEGLNAAAIALAETLAVGRFEVEILALLRHWAKSGNPALARVALAAFNRCFTQARIEPALQARIEPALEAIEASMATPMGWPLFLDIMRLFRRIIEADAGLGIVALRRWIAPGRADSLRYLSALLAIQFLQLEDAVNPTDGAPAADVIGTLWDDTSLPNHPEVQEETTKMIKDWACRALALVDENRLEEFAQYRQWFQTLHERYAHQRRDRLRLQLERWDRLRELSAQRLATRKGAGNAPGNPSRPYCDLLGSD